MIDILKIFLDLEATQYSKEIISIGAISDKGETFYSLVRCNTKVTKLITNLTGISNNDLKNQSKFYKVFDSFWKWCCGQKKNKQEDIMFIVYGNFDGELIKAEYLRRPDDKRLFYMMNNIVDYQYYLMMHLYGSISTSLSLLNASKLLTKNDSLEQDHNALNDAILLKLLYDSVGVPNIENLITAEKENYVRNIKKMFAKKQIRNNNLNCYLTNKETLTGLNFDEIKDYIDLNFIRKSVYEDYKILSGKDLFTKIENRDILKERES